MLKTAQWPAVAAKFPWTAVGNGNFKSTVARLSYANLFVAKAYQGASNGPNDKSEPRFGVTLLLPKGDNAAALVAGLKEVIRAEYGEKCTIGEPSSGAKPSVQVDYVKDGKPARANLAWPLVDQGSTLSDGYEGGSFYIAAYSYEKVAVVDSKCTPITDQNKVYSGCYAFATIRPYYSATYKRLCIGLQGVQFLIDGERFGGGAPSIADQFGDVSADFGAIAAEAVAGGASERASLLD